jgi:hypothetical protein
MYFVVVASKFMIVLQAKLTNCPSMSLIGLMMLD